MKKIIYLAIIGIALIWLGSFAVADMDDFTRAEEIIEQRIPCSELSLSDLEKLGDYFIEQMHPGELHEIMDERMGGEGSESLRQAHINMGRMFYCGQSGAMSAGMMNMMMGRGTMPGFGMMGNSYYGTENNSFSFFSIIILILLIAVLVLIIIWLVKQINREEKRTRK